MLASRLKGLDRKGRGELNIPKLGKKRKNEENVEMFSEFDWEANPGLPYDSRGFCL